MNRSGVLRGYLMIAASAVLYSISVLMVRVAANAGSPVSLTLLSRFAFQTPFFYCQMIVAKIPLVPTSTFGRKILLTCGSLITTACLGYVVASAWAPLGNANAIGGTFPVGTLVVARIWLKEPFGHSGLPALVLSAAGVIVISLSETTPAPMASSRSLEDDAAAAPMASLLSLEKLGYAAAAISAVANSFAYAAVRRAGDAMEPLQYMVLFSALGLLITLPLVCCDASLWALSLRAWMGLLPPIAAATTSGALAQMLLGYGSMTPGVTAGLTSLLSSSEMVWAYVLQVTVLQEPASRATVLGAGLIVLAIAAPFAECEAKRRYASSTDGKTSGQRSCTTASADAPEELVDIEAQRLIDYRPLCGAR